MEMFSPPARRTRAPKPITAASVLAAPVDANGEAAARPARLHALDALRGLAIVLMTIDHAAAMFGGMRIEPGNVRFFTRLAEPLFVVLFGYMLAGRGRRRVLSRAGTVALAALAVNLLFASTFHRLDILATFLVAIGVYMVLGDWLVLLLPAFFFAAWDPAGALFDYLPAVVVSQVALGMLLRKRWGLYCALPFGLAWLSVPSPHLYNVLFTVPAAVLVVLACRRPHLHFPILGFLGRWPLRIYVVQFLILFAGAIGYVLAGGTAAGPRFVVARLSASLDVVLGWAR